jgi:hypothetical protein
MIVEGLLLSFAIKNDSCSKPFDTTAVLGAGERYAEW